MVKGLIAGGFEALNKSIENVEDDFEQGWKDLKQHKCYFLDHPTLAKRPC